jgi:primosomal protein N''
MAPRLVSEKVKNLAQKNTSWIVVKFVDVAPQHFSKFAPVQRRAKKYERNLVKKLQQCRSMLLGYGSIMVSCTVLQR